MMQLWTFRFVYNFTLDKSFSFFSLKLDHSPGLWCFVLFFTFFFFARLFSSSSAVFFNLWVSTFWKIMKYKPLQSSPHLPPAMHRQNFTCNFWVYGAPEVTHGPLAVPWSQEPLLYSMFTLPSLFSSSFPLDLNRPQKETQSCRVKLQMIYACYVCPFSSKALHFYSFIQWSQMTCPNLMVLSSFPFFLARR